MPAADALIPPLLLIGVPALLALSQPDLGTAALFAIIGAGMMFLAGLILLEGARRLRKEKGLEKAAK